jgi:hypothetical protein
MVALARGTAIAHETTSSPGNACLGRDVEPVPLGADRRRRAGPPPVHRRPPVGRTVPGRESPGPQQTPRVDRSRCPAPPCGRLTRTRPGRHGRDCVSTAWSAARPGVGRLRNGRRIRWPGAPVSRMAGRRSREAARTAPRSECWRVGVPRRPLSRPSDSFPRPLAQPTPAGRGEEPVTGARKRQPAPLGRAVIDAFKSRRAGPGRTRSRPPAHPPPPRRGPRRPLRSPRPSWTTSAH